MHFFVKIGDQANPKTCGDLVLEAVDPVYFFGVGASKSRTVGQIGKL